MSTRKERAERARKRKCSNCGEDGPHFVPPSFGDRGFYICEPKPSLIRGDMPADADG